MTIRSQFNLTVGLLGLLLLAVSMVGCGSESTTQGNTLRLLNVSYDPTRGFYEEFNKAFVKEWEKNHSETVEVKQSHGGSGGQALKVINGIALADVVTLALAFDIDVIHKKANLLPADWQSRLPENSAPYTSTIVFLVRKGNPKGIHDWDDLLKEGVEVITPDPKSSGGARWGYLAAWGFALKKKLGDFSKLRDPSAVQEVTQAQDEAKEFVRKLFTHVRGMAPGARAATMSFTRDGQGDVLLAWENEAFFSLKEAGEDKYEIVCPSISILAEPAVAVVDVVAEKHGTKKIAEEYLKYLYSPVGQTLAAKHGYRPRHAEGVPEEYMKKFRKLDLFTIDEVFGGWQKAQPMHFNDHGIFDQIYKP